MANALLTQIKELLKRTIASAGTLLGYIIALFFLSRYDLIPTKWDEIFANLVNAMITIGYIIGFVVALWYFITSAHMTVKKFLTLKALEIEFCKANYKGESVSITPEGVDANVKGAVMDVARAAITPVLTKAASIICGNPGPKEEEEEPKPTKEEKKAIKETEKLKKKKEEALQKAKEAYEVYKALSQVPNEEEEDS